MRGGVAALVGVLALAPGIGHAFAILGPSRAEVSATDHSSKTPESSGFQPFGSGFRWSEQELTYAIHGDVTAAFGQAGDAAIGRAFDTWDAAFGATATHAGILTGQNPVADLESIVLHEIGHALGLHHPDKALGGFGDPSFNFDKNGNNVAVDLDAVMRSDLEVGEINRVLTQDDIDGFNHLYDPAKTFPMLGLKAGAVSVVQGTPPGDLSFTMQGAATVGGTAGANIDIFLMNFADANVKAQTWIYGGVGSGGNLQAAGQTMGGFFDGVPFDLHAAGTENANHGQSLVSIDIFINRNPAAQIGLNAVVVPEPGGARLVGLGLLLLLGAGRSTRSAGLRVR